MLLDFAHRYAQGAHADVFFSADRLVVYKLFRRGLNDEQRRRDTFASEVAAYHIAMADPFLSRHAAPFLSALKIEDVLQEGLSISRRYLLDCCYMLGFLPGHPVKFRVLPAGPRYEHLHSAAELFSRAAIDRLGDSSVFNPENPVAFRFIDFATSRWS